MLSPEFPRHSSKCPINPNPVISVHAFTIFPFFFSNSLNASAWYLFKLFIDSIASLTHLSFFSFTKSLFTPVIIVPTPIDFVITITSSVSIVAFFHTKSGSQSPFTDKPNFGSLSSIEWPPNIGTPASSALSAAPMRICLRISIDSLWMGKATIVSALIGSPPIA